MNHRLAVPVAAALVFAACSGGDDDTSATTAPTTPPATVAPSTAPPTTAPAPTTEPTAPPTTAPPATTPPTAPPTTEPPTTDPPDEPQPVEVNLIDTVGAGEGLLTMSFAEGWRVLESIDGLETFYEDAEGLAFTASEDSLEQLILLENADTQMLVIREGRYVLVDSVFAWESDLLDILGIMPNFSFTREWAGGRGNSTRGRVGDGYVRIDSVAVGDQILAAITFTPNEPSEQLDAEVTAMTDSFIVDPAAVPKLAHSIDLFVFLDGDEPGSTWFEFSILAPPTWIEDQDITAFWSDPAVPPDAPEIPSIDIYTFLDDRPLDTLIDEEFTARATAWFEIDIVPTESERTVDGVPFRVFWEGPPGEAIAAVVMGGDGRSFLAAYIWTPGEPELLIEMIDSIIVPVSTVNPSDS